MKPSCGLILARISRAEFVITPEGPRELDTEGVQSQVSDLLNLAADLGWTVGPPETHHIIENDVSAFNVRMVTLPAGEPWNGARQRRPRRPEFWRAIQMLYQGQADGALTVDLDRSTRHPRDLEDIIDAVELLGVPVVDLSGEIDLTSNAGRGRARNKVARANEASADTSRRVARKKRQHAHNGRYLGGPRRYGFETRGPAKGRYLVVLEAEADEICGMGAQILRGVSLRQVALDLRKRGVKTTTGKDWTAGGARRCLLNPAVAGLLTYRPAPPAGVPVTAKARLYSDDQIIGEAPWDPIIRREDWEEIRSILTDASRRSHSGAPPRWLVSYIATCENCHEFIAVANRKGVPTYRCRGCSRYERRADLVDKWVRARVVARLSQPDAVKLLPQPVAPEDLKRAESERAQLAARKASVARMVAVGTMDEADFAEASVALREKLRELDKRIAGLRQLSPLDGIAGNADAGAVWDAMPLGLRRQVLRTCTESITFGPVEGRPASHADAVMSSVKVIMAA